VRALRPEISVVLATRDRADSLDRLLGILAAQLRAPAFEVVVVDNGGRDRTPEVLERFRDRLRIVALREEAPGKGRALNRALEAARGDLIVFTDDDVLPRPDWLAEFSAGAGRHPGSPVFGGRIRVDEEAVPGWVRRSGNLMGLLAVRHDLGTRDLAYGWGEYPYGPNMAVRVSCLEGGRAAYPERLGPGTAVPVGDESAFLQAISPPEADDRTYLGAAVVTHPVDPEAFRFGRAARRCFLAGLAHGLLGVPLAPPGDGGAGAVPRRMARRLAACRSARELACICIRTLGWRRGRSLRG